MAQSEKYIPPEHARLLQAIDQAAETWQRYCQVQTDRLNVFFAGRELTADLTSEERRKRFEEQPPVAEVQGQLAARVRRLEALGIDPHPTLQAAAGHPLADPLLDVLRHTPVRARWLRGTKAEAYRLLRVWREEGERFLEGQRAEVAASTPAPSVPDWSQPDTVARWAKAWGVSRRAMGIMLRTGKVRNIRISRQSYQVAIEDIPAPHRRRFRQAP
jgi:hypothetical protein